MSTCHDDPDPDRWVDVPPDAFIEMRQICRACPRRGECAQLAVETPGVRGMYAGVVVPSFASSRAYQHAIEKLTSLATFYGHAPSFVQRHKRRHAMLVQNAQLARRAA